MIPRVIHQLWIGPRPAPMHWIATWRAAHPDWTHVLWDNDRCARFGFRNQREIDAMPEWNGKADIMRYEILARHGGLFFDADAICLRPLDERFLRHDSWTCYESEAMRPGLLAPGYMGAVPGCELMERCVAMIRGADVARDRAWITVGPRLFTDAARGYDRLHVYPSGLFIPRHHTGHVQPAGEPPFADQMWDSTALSQRGVRTLGAVAAVAVAAGGAWWLWRRRQRALAGRRRR